MQRIEVLVTNVFERTHEAIIARTPDNKRKYRYIIHEGSSRSSKTRSIIQICHKYGNEFPSKRMSVWRSTKKDCKDTVGKDVEQVFPTLPFAQHTTYNKTDSVYTFKSGSVFEIQGTDDANKIHGYNSHVIWLNEPYDLSRDTFDQLDMRCEDIVFIDWNPQQAHWIDELKKDPRAIVIHSTFLDNPYCPIEQKIKILSYQPVKMCRVVEQKILQESEAKVYDITENKLGIAENLLKELARCKENERIGTSSAYNWSVYGLGTHAEKPNRIFFWQEVSTDTYNAIDSPKYHGSDWGTVDPWGILEAKYYDGCLYLHELNYKSENEWRESLTMQENERLLRDPEGGIVRHVFQHLNIDKKKYIICDNNRPLKIQALWDAGYDYALAASKLPGSIIDGIDILNSMKVYYTSSSFNIKYEQENYERTVDRYGVVLNEPVDKHNHLIDPSRYIAIFLKLMGIIK